MKTLLTYIIVVLAITAGWLEIRPRSTAEVPAHAAEATQ